ncbi:chemotaxis protein CheB [Sphingobium yanoikuyae]|uniref:CheB-type methylesterase domain-containing protein n=1 Tax=Sphingobium yanoikuyae TaxID=13690 RepID=A0A9X7U4K5_SPHYA|nr:hypothetical protein H3V42_15960 [Sphingobium yanoikuyae]
MPISRKNDIIAIGGSAGSSAVLKQILSDLPSELQASIFISTHIPAPATTETDRSGP